jgi:hypothetical protein
MSALPPKADIIPHGLECLLCAKKRHLMQSTSPAISHLDAGGGAVYRINSGRCAFGLLAVWAYKQNL